jgi:hypothetical protein
MTRVTTIIPSIFELIGTACGETGGIGTEIKSGIFARGTIR